MKNLILDTPFRDSFSDYLVKGETIVWKGQPSLKSASSFESDPDDSNNYDRYAIASSFFIGFILLYATRDTPYAGWLFFTILLFIMVIIPTWMIQKKKNYTYVITQNQILFQFKKSWRNKKTLHSIPFSEIKNIIVVMAYDIEKIKADYRNAYEAIPEVYNRTGLEKIGTIFIVPTNPKSINFETTDLLHNEKRHLPTLELLDNVNDVAKIIQEGIKNSKRLK